jgi:hypothetical protein
MNSIRILRGDNLENLTTIASMIYKRWYPSATTTPTGEVVIVGGTQVNSSIVLDGAIPIKAGTCSIYETFE